MTTPTTPAARPARCRLLGLVAAGFLVAALAGCGSEDETSPVASDDTSSSAGAGTEPSSIDSGASASTAPPATPPASPTVPAGTPECAEVWQDGARIPGGYRGCVADGALVKADKLGCESGQAIIRYADRFYGVAGGTVHGTSVPLLDDPGYTETVAGCRA